MANGFLSQYPRLPLAHTPTPLEYLPRLTDYLQGPALFVKRDDCTGLATGGNKTRKLEFLVGAAIEEGCDTLVTVGGLQSNHARQTAAAAAKAGLECELLLQEIPNTPEGNYDYNGNLLLDGLLGARVHRYPPGAFMNEELESFVSQLRDQGRKPYAVPLGGSNAIGALGYAVAVQELGSGGTQAGVLAGLAAAKSDVGVIGINVSATEVFQRQKVLRLTHETCALLGVDAPGEDAVVCDDNYYLPGYGVVNEGMVHAVRLFAEKEGVVLDPVYTGKAMAGLLDLVHKGRFPENSTVVFLHTGGSSGLFAYPRDV